MNRKLWLCLMVALVSGCATTPRNQKAGEPVATEQAPETTQVFVDSTPQQVRETSALGDEVRSDLKPVSKPAPESQGSDAVTADGYAIRSSSVDQARGDAIRNALAVAILKQYGPEALGQTPVRNYFVTTARVLSIAENPYCAYQVLEESLRGDLYRVRARVEFTQNPLAGAQGQGPSCLLVGQETMGIGLDTAPSAAARRAVADAFAQAGLRVKLEDREAAGADRARQSARSNQYDFSVYLSADARLQDRFGDFFSYKSVIEYQLMLGSTGEVIAGGRVEGLNKKRPLTAKEAAEASLHDVGMQAGNELLGKLTSRYRHTVPHGVYFDGVKDRKVLDTLMTQLRAVPGVKEARPAASKGTVCFVSLILSREAQPTITEAVRRLPNVEVLESDLYTTVAQVH